MSSDSEPEPEPEKNNTDLTLVMVLGLFGLLACFIFLLYNGYLYMAEDVLNWDERSTYTVGMSILLLLYSLLLVRLMRPIRPKEGQTELTEREKSHERIKPVSILGVSAVMVFLLGWIFYKNRVVWLIPGSIGLTLISGACLLLVIADYIQYKITGRRSSLVPIPIWVVLFFMLINRAIHESGG